jgi:branched-chain amino acid transport system permease protein
MTTLARLDVRRLSPQNRLIGGLVALAVFMVLPFLINSSYFLHIAILGMLYAVVASNWDLTLGYAGVFNFAHSAFFGVGAYTSGILAIRYGVSPWIGIIAGMFMAMVVSVVVSVPAIRLRGIYVALITFACSQLIVLLLLSQPALSGGQQGLPGLPGLSIGDFQFRQNPIAYYYLVGILLVGSTYTMIRLVRSDFGLSLIALRDFEAYAVSRGVPLARQRFLAFVISSIFTGLAGGIFAHYLIVASPEFFGFSFSTLFLSMILVGGSSTILGPVAMGVVMTFFSELMSTWGPARFMVLAVVIVATMRFLPKGVWGLFGRRSS